MKSVGGPHAARGPRVGQHWSRARKAAEQLMALYNCFSLEHLVEARKHVGGWFGFGVSVELEHICCNFSL